MTFYNKNPSKFLHQHNSRFIEPAGILQTTGSCFMKNGGEMVNADLRPGCPIAAPLFCRFD
jgi:hypothetical protein